MTSKRISLLVLLALLLVLVAGIGAASARAKAGTSIRLSRGQLRQARNFWTPARMRRARPLEVGQPGAAASTVRDGSLPEIVPDPTLPAFAEHGVVFIVGPGFLGRCSATSVNAPNRSVVFTAGHCVHEGRHWFDREWVFVPGYHYGIRPFGVFVAKWLGSTPGWVSSENENFDVGAAVVTRNERGQRLATAVGGANIAWNLPPQQVFDVYGYPVEAPFDGATLRRCPQTPFEGHDITSFLSPGPLDLAVKCDVTGGASGGGWLIDGNTLDGVTTFGYTEDPATDFGPYFGAAVGKLFREAAAIG